VEGPTQSPRRSFWSRTVVVLLAAYCFSQSSQAHSKSSKADSISKQKHSNDEIADWIISRANFSSCEGSCYPRFSTSVSKVHDACTLQVQTSELMYGPPPDDKSHQQIESYVYNLPLATINPDRIETGTSGHPDAQWVAIFVHTTNDKPTLTITTKYVNLEFEEGKMQQYPIDQGSNSVPAASFYVKDDAVAKRLTNAFKDLITQCGGKPDKKEIY